MNSNEFGWSEINIAVNQLIINEVCHIIIQNTCIAQIISLEVNYSELIDW